MMAKEWDGHKGSSSHSLLYEQIQKDKYSVANSIMPSDANPQIVRDSRKCPSWSSSFAEIPWVMGFYSGPANVTNNILLHLIWVQWNDVYKLTSGIFLQTSDPALYCCSIVWQELCWWIAKLPVLKSFLSGKYGYGGTDCMDGSKPCNPELIL